MKYKLTIVISFLLVMYTPLQSQTDNHWIHVEGQQGAGTFIELSEVSPPCYCGDTVRNDVFIIFKDNTYFNGRLPGGYVDGSTPEFSLSNNRDAGAPFQKEINYRDGSVYLKNEHKAEIKHIYWTNVYQGDDPPEDYQISNSNRRYIQISPTPTDSAIDTNHSIRSGRDITLIINNAYFDQKLKIHIYGRKIGEQSGDWQPVSIRDFTPTEHINSTGIVVDGGSINTGTSNGPYTFINLNTRDEIHTDYNYMRFTIIDKDGQPHHHIEPVDDVHDPNFIRFNRICTSEDKSSCIEYDVQVRNDGMMTATNIEVLLDFPFKAKYFNLLQMDMGSITSIRDCNIFVSHNNGTIKLKFKNAYLPPCTKNSMDSDNQAIGQFKLIVYTEDHISSNQESLYPIKPWTKFDKHKYALQKIMIDEKSGKIKFNRETCKDNPCLPVYSFDWFGSQFSRIWRCNDRNYNRVERVVNPGTNVYRSLSN